MNLIFKTLFGSHVYGTNLPTSDMDYKAIYIPEPKDIILGQVRETIQNNTKLDKTQRNSKDDVDLETFSVKKYLQLLIEGQTVSLDMLFTPESFWLESSEIWNEIRRNKEKFLNSKVNSFIGYTRQQAAKYGVKGTRVAAMRQVLGFLGQHDPKAKLGSCFIDVLPKELENEFINIVTCNGPQGKPEPHLEVCNRKIPFHATVKYAESCFQKIFDEYGHRARLAEQNQGIDWKALMHAVRVENEALELLTTGNITFPRPEKDLLLKIRKGEMPYPEVASIIEEGLERIDNTKSVLRPESDKDFVENFVYNVYHSVIKK